MDPFDIIVFVALLIFIYGVFSKLAENSVISAPMFFTGAGLLVSPACFNLINVKFDGDVISLIAKIALILILFSDAAGINLRELKNEVKYPVRLLLIGLPLTMLLGWVLAIPFFGGYSFTLLAILAFILSPTDAALGLAVVNNKNIPDKIRQTINVESGLNDGMVLPPIIFCISLLGISAGSNFSLWYWILFLLKQLILGAAIGGIVGWIGGWIINDASDRKWMSQKFQRMVAISIAILAYALAEIIGGNGYIAAFFAGLLLGVHTAAIRKRIQEYGETEGQQFSLFVFLIFGLVMVPWSVNYWNWSVLLYALLSLTIIRMLPVMISLYDSGIDMKTKLFIGWFGPRGISSILYLLLIVSNLGIKGNEVILSTIVLTVLLSIYVHGFSAIPLSKLYVRKENNQLNGE